ncbi:hypothetical protein WJX79_001899 [Trebouxia sp. C0005]
MDRGVTTPFALSTIQVKSPGSVSSDGEEVIPNSSQIDQRDSAADFDTVLAAANLKIKLVREAEAAADRAFRQDDSKPVVITFLPCCNETEEELSNPLSLVNNPDADAKRLLDRVNMQFYVVVDGQHDDAPETSTLKALKEILKIDEEQDPPVRDRGCNMYHLFRNGFEVFVYVKENPKAGGIAGNIGINNYHMGNPLICSQVLLPLFSYCQLDNFAWGTRGIDATEAAGEGTKEIAEKKAYEWTKRDTAY